jgi:hypothetical protein
MASRKIHENPSFLYDFPFKPSFIRDFPIFSQVFFRCSDSAAALNFPKPGLSGLQLLLDKGLVG